MAYLLLDDGFAEHTKVAGLSHVAFRIHVVGLCFCARNLTDGNLTPREARVIAAVVDVGATQFKRHLNELVAAGLWVKCGDGFLIHDYLDHNPSAAHVKAKREAGRKAANTRWGNADSNAPPNAEPIAEPNGKTPPLPSPSGLSTSPPSLRGHENGYWDRLVAACGNTHDALLKLKRASKGCAEGDIVYALECCTGPGVADPLAVALSTLKKRRTV